MLKRMKYPAFLVLVTGITVVGAAAPSFAGTVYSWTTEDGTMSFTDDAKRIPAKYKAVAKQRQIGALKSYPRLTESDVKYAAPYHKRVADRLDALRAEPPAVSAAPPGMGDGRMRYDVGIGDAANDQLSLPVGVGGLSEEPVTTSNHRIRMRDSIATQDVQITKQGDKILSVNISPRNQRGVTERDVQY